MRKGIFNRDELSSGNVFQNKRVSCFSCGLYSGCNSPNMQASGKGEKGILNIGEAPGERDDEISKQWQGKMGRKLSRMYSSLGIDLFRDCRNINAVNCRPPGNKTPSSYQIACCRKNVIKEIETTKPDIIMLFGNAAIESLIGNRWNHDNVMGVSRWRGCNIPDQKYRAWINPVFHPSYVSRDAKDSVKETIWKKDIEKALGNYLNPVPFKPLTSYIDSLVLLSDERTTAKALPDILSKNTPFKVIDLETTGLKPHKSGHKIVCLSIATSTDKSYAFPFPKLNRTRKKLAESLSSSDITWAGHNIVFEQRWLRHFLGVETINWGWDSMLYAHRQRSTLNTKGLDFQTYVNFGIIDYSSDIKPSLKSHSNNGNAMNKITDLWDKEPEKLLKYCALDSLFEYLLAEKQTNGAINV